MTHEEQAELRALQDGYELECAKLEDELNRYKALYQQAVRGRQEFRSAFREERETRAEEKVILDEILAWLDRGGTDTLEKLRTLASELKQSRTAQAERTDTVARLYAQLPLRISDADAQRIAEWAYDLGARVKEEP